MPRFFCVYYIDCDDAKKVSKIFKKTRVIEADNNVEAMFSLKVDYDATFVKYVRDMNKDTPSYFDSDLDVTEKVNNLILEDGNLFN